MNLNEFASFFKIMRQKMGLTQVDIANLLCVTDKAISKWERGICLPDVSLFPQIASIFGISLSELIYTTAKNNQSSNATLTETEGDQTGGEIREAVSVVLSEKNATVSPLIFGNNLEHTRASIYGGLSAQLIKNRKFAGKPMRNGCFYEWFPIGNRAHFSTAPSYTRHVEEHKMKRWNEKGAQRVHNLYNATPCGIGQGELFLEGARQYHFEILLRAMQDSTPVQVRFVREADRLDLLTETYTVGRGEWQKFVCDFTPMETGEYELRVEIGMPGAFDVGCVSLMPADNFHGMRRDVIECLRETGVSLLRWPGGNFAGEYRWKDGLLDVNERAPLNSCLEIETQPNSRGYDFHEINTDDFVALCREISALPCITINPSWDSPEDCADWVEYCNGDETTEYGRLRIQRGFEKPYNVVMWSLGNEFGYGHMEGANNPSGYSALVRKDAQQMKTVSPNITFISSGCFPKEEWFRYSAVPLADIAPIFSYHHYSPYMYDVHTTKQGHGRGDVNFACKEELREAYYAMLADVDKTEECLKSMQPYLNGKLKISFDEWNVWYQWYRVGGVAEGMFVAKMLHMLMANADLYNIFLACYFEMVNEGGINVQKDTAVLTPIGKVFSLCSHHKNGTVVYANGDDSGFATKKDGVVTVTLVNYNFESSRDFLLPYPGADFSGRMLISDSILPYSVFVERDLSLLDLQEGKLTLPPHAIAILFFKEF